MSGFAVGMAVGAVLVFALTVAAKNRGPLDATGKHICAKEAPHG